MPTTKTPVAKGEAKPKIAKTPAIKETAAKKVTAKPAAAKNKAKKTLSTAADGYVKITQMVGCIGRRHDQEATLIGLGLNKRHRSKVLENTPSVRGMIYKVRHLVKTEKAS